jgi:hypothetical protein
MSNAALDALERLYVNVRPEYPFGVRDWELVKDYLERAGREAGTWNERVLALHESLDAAEARAQKAEAERDIMFKGDWAALNLRVQKAEAVVEAARRLRDATDNAERSAMFGDLYNALTAYDEPPPREYVMTSDGWQPDPDQPGYEANFSALGRPDEPPTEQATDFDWKQQEC